jgi:hypothetical protein
MIADAQIYCSQNHIEKRRINILVSLKGKSTRLCCTVGLGGKEDDKLQTEASRRGGLDPSIILQNVTRQ